MVRGLISNAYVGGFIMRRGSGFLSSSRVVTFSDLAE